MNLTYGYLQHHGYRCVHTVEDSKLILLFGQLFSSLFLKALPTSLIVSLKMLLVLSLLVFGYDAIQHPVI